MDSTITGQAASWTIFSIRLERVIRALAEPDERHVGALSRRDLADVLDLDLARDHLMPEGGDDRCDERQAILPLVRDEDAQMLGLATAHGTYRVSIEPCRKRCVSTSG